MALRRYTKPVDGTIPVEALLYSEEQLLASQDGVGMYFGSQKSADHQNGTMHVTSHRLFFLNAHRASTKSFEMALSLIVQTEYYAGLFKSSPKVTCHLSGDPVDPGSAQREEGAHAQFDSWECEVCAYRNPPGLSPAAARICALCGVPRTALPTPIISVSSSLPSSALSSSTALSGHENPCPACTFLNHPSLRSCEICSTDLPRRELKSAPSSRPISPDPDDEQHPKMIKISFRKGGDKPFYAILKRSLKSKAWEDTTNSTEPTVGIGISGILRTVESSAKGRETHMRDAFQDLEVFMVKAKDMVKLAAELNDKLTAASTSALPEPEEATFIRSSLAQLGLQMSGTSVTLDMMKDERNWFDELARELARVLQGPQGMMKNRGIIALDEVWGGWNRARGVALIPPSTLLQVVPHLPAHTNPTISHQAFASGLNVLHTPPYTPAAFNARLSSFLMMSGPKTTIEISAEEDLTVALIMEMINAAERAGGICRDDNSAAITGGGSGIDAELRWWANLFNGYIWDGQE